MSSAKTKVFPLQDGYFLEETTSLARVALLDMPKRKELDELLRMKAMEACSKHGLDYIHLHPVSRAALTHYRCTGCGVQPLYYIDTRSLNKTRCGVCMRIVRLKNAGKHGKVRKAIALSLRTTRL